MLHKYVLCVLLCVAGTFALYNDFENIVKLSAKNFNRKVTNSDDVWLVQFYAPWCKYSQRFAPEFITAAEGLKGYKYVKVGVVNADKYETLSQKHKVGSFPEVMIFTGSRHRVYNGELTAKPLIKEVLKMVKKYNKKQVLRSHAAADAGLADKV